MSDVLNIELTTDNPDALISIKKGKDGTISKKLVGVEDLGAILASSHKFSTGILPKGTRFYSGTSREYCIGIETPPMVKICELLDKDTTEIKKIPLPFPSCLFTFRITDKVVVKTHVHALVRPVLSESDKLYVFPYGNTYKVGGKVCWGGVKLPKIKAPLDTVILVSQFLDSRYNGDLFECDTIDFGVFGSTKETFDDFIKYIKDSDRFLPELLVYDESYTVRNVMKGYRNNG